MQQTQRRAHLRIWSVLAIALPVLFAAALWLRQPVPIETQVFPLPQGEDAQ